MKKTLILFVASFLPLFSFAQNNINGNIINFETKMALSDIFVKVLLQDKIIAYTQTDSLGVFNFKEVKNGVYLLNIEDPNFQPYEFEINLSNNYTINNLELKPIESLGEVVIVGKKMVEFTSTGNNLNVEGTELARKKSAIEVLSFAPTVSTHNGLSVLGSDDVVVKVNGKELNLPETSLMNFLHNLNPENIQKIEIKDVKTADMGAETDATINILLKKNMGTNIDLSYINLNLTNKFIENSGGDIAIYHRTNKFRFSTDFYSRRHNHQFVGNEKHHYADNTQFVIEKINPNIKRRELAVDFGIDYLLDSLNTISVLYNYFYDRALDINPIENNSISNVQDLDSIFSKKLGNSKDLYHTYSAFYDRKLDDRDSHFIFTTSYAQNSENSPMTVYNQFFKNNSLLETEELKMDNKTTNQIYSIQSDLNKIFKNENKLEVGIKIVQTKIIDQFVTEEKISNLWTILDAYSDNFNFNELITSLYGSYSLKNDKNSWSFGLRNEFSYNNFTFSGQPNIKSNYNNLVPTLNYKRFFSKTKILTFFTNSNIVRPSFYYFNPTTTIVNTTTHLKGNPEIKAYTNYRTGVQYVFNSKYVGQLSYSYSNDFFYSKPRYDAQTGITTTSYQNEGKLSSAKLYLNLPIQIVEWWNIQNKLTTSYSNYLLDNQKFNGWKFNVGTTNTFELPKNITLDFDWNYTSPYKSQYYDFKENFVTNASLNIPLFNEMIELSMGYNDIFNSEKTRYDYGFQDIKKNVYSKLNTQKIIFSISFSFQSGKERDIDEKESNIEDVKNRLGKE